VLGPGGPSVLWRGPSILWFPQHSSAAASQKRSAAPLRCCCGVTLRVCKPSPVELGCALLGALGVAQVRDPVFVAAQVRIAPSLEYLGQMVGAGQAFPLPPGLEPSGPAFCAAHPLLPKSASSCLRKHRARLTACGLLRPKSAHGSVWPVGPPENENDAKPHVAQSLKAIEARPDQLGCLWRVLFL
jgi:hypothetical protein